MNNHKYEQAEPLDWVQLCLDSNRRESGHASVAVIIRAIAALDRLTRLLSGAYHSDSDLPLKPLVELTREFENQYELVLGHTQPGSYVIPLGITYKDGVIPEVFKDVVEPSRELSQMTRYFDRVLIASSDGNGEKFENLFPHPDTGLRMITAVRKLILANNEYSLKINTPTGGKALLDSRRDVDSVYAIQKKYQKIVSSGVFQEDLSLVAELEAIDKVAGKFRARTIEGHSFEGLLKDLDVKDLSITPSRIEIEGTFALDGSGKIQSVKSIDSASTVETYELNVSEFKANNEHLIAAPPLMFQVSQIASDFYLLEGDLGVLFHAVSKEEIKELLYQSLEDLWVEYALEEDSKLSAEALELKKELRDRLKQK